jgi:hypothetical protein
MSRDRSSAEARVSAITFASYLLVFAILAFPWLATGRSAIPAHESELHFLPDAKLLVWVLAWVAHALTTAPSSLFDANIFHPAPRQLTGSEACLSSQVLAMPVFALTGNAVLTANVLAFASYPIAAWAMARLGRHCGFGGLVAWVGGLVYALGPLRVPANLQVLQYLHLYLPLALLALERVRAVPTVRRSIVLAGVVLLGAGSSLYMAAMLGVTLVVWASVAHAGTGERRRFLLLALAGTSAAYAAVALLSFPYFARTDAPTVARVTQALGQSMGSVHRDVLWRLPGELLGHVPLGLALAGLSALFSPSSDARRTAWTGVTLVAVGLLFMLGPAQQVAGVTIPLPFTLLNLHAYGVLRMPWRFAVVVGLGTTLLCGAALGEAERRFGARTAATLTAAAAVLFLATLGRAFVATPFEEIRAVGRDRAVYAAVGAVARERGGGPILELPLARGPTLDAAATDHMIASTVHWLPIVDGYTGYPPPHRDGLMLAIARLPDPDALVALVRMTGLRWILLAPADRWERPAARAPLHAMTGLRQVFERDGWLLLEVVAVP